jgi:beta-phosphoglucomutase
VSRGAVIFDVDGVLVDSAAAHKQSWQECGEVLGRPISDEEFQRTFGRSSRDIIRFLFGAATSEQEIANIDARKEALYRELIRDRVPLMPGAKALLDRLLAAEHPLAIGSSGPRENIAMVVDALDAREAFGAIVNGFDVKRGKPDPQVFLLAASRLGVSPASCVVVEDAPAGVEAAKRGGMRAIALTSGHDRGALEGADLIVDHLDAISSETIEGLLGRR